jgi:hypothetical protein
MAKKISSSDLFTKEDIFEGVRLSAQKTIDTLNILDAEFKELANAMQSSLKGATTTTTQGLNTFVQTTQKANSLMEQSINITKLKAQAEQQLQKANQEAEKTAQQREKTAQANLRTQQQQTKEAERVARAQEKATRTAQNEASAYKRLEKNTRDLKNESKRLGAEMLALERSGKRNSAEYKKLSAQYDMVTNSARRGDSQLKKLDKQVGDNFRNVGNYAGAMSKLNSVLGAFGIGFGLAHVVGGIKNFLSESIDAYQYAKEVLAQVDAGLKSTGNKVGFTIEELQQQAYDLRQATQIDDDKILQDVTSILITFTSIRGQVFKDAQQAVLDLSTRMGGDLNKASVQIGKALNDPIKGITALKRVGVSFTESQQDMIKSLVETGKLEEAQTMILKELNTEFGGSAKAAAEADGGFKRFQNGIMDIQDHVGNLITHALLPLADSMGKWMESITLEDVKKIANILGTLGKVVMSLARMWATYRLATMAQTLANNALGGSFVKVVQRVGLMKASLMGLSRGLKALKTAIASNPFGLLITIGTEIYANWDQIQELFTGVKVQTDEMKEAMREYNAEIVGSKEYTAEMNKYVGEETTAFVGLIEQLRNTTYESEERQKLIDQINSQYGTTLTNIKDETLFTKQLNVAVANYIALKEQEFKIKKNEEQITKVIERKNAAVQRLTEKQKTLREEEERLEGIRANSRKTFDPTLVKQYQKDIEIAEYNIIKYGEAVAVAQAGVNDYDRQLNQLGGSILNTKGRISELTAGYGDLDEEVEGASGSTDKHKGKQKEINTEFKKANEYLSQQEELLNKISDIESKRAITDLEKRISDEVELQKSKVAQSGEYDLNEFTKLVSEKYELEVNRILDQATFEQEQNDKKYQREKQARIDALADEYKDLKKGAEGNANEIAKIDKNYADAKQKLADEEKLIYADLITQNQLLSKEATDEAEALDKSRIDFTKATNEDLLNSQKEYLKSREDLTKEADDKEIEALKKKEEEKRAIISATADILTKQSEKRVEQMDAEIAKAEEQLQHYKQMAQEGNITAQESLAEQQRIIDEANLKKEREQKRQQRIKLAESVYSTYSAKVEAGSSNPLAETIRDTTLLQQFISSLPTFLEGTEDTGTNGRGIDGKGGFHAVLHPNERVIPKNLNEKIGALSNIELTKMAQEYQNGRMMEGATQSASALEFSLLINEMRDLKQVIKDKPETSIGLGEITQSMVEIVEKRVRGNSVTFNRFKVRK